MKLEIMKEYKIHFEQDLSDDYLTLINEYWKINTSDFKNKPKQISLKHNITITELNKIIKENSFCNMIDGHCNDCSVIIENKVYSQTSFKLKSRVSLKERCKECESQFYKNQEAERVKLDVLEKHEIEEQFEKAIKQKKWNELTNEELVILTEIVRLKTKSLIYSVVFNGDPFDKAIWRKIGSIEKKGLVVISRSPSKGVIEFLYPVKLEKLLLIKENNSINDELDFLSFSLSKNLNKTLGRQPDYSGTFKLKRPIRLEAEIKYIYGGWVNSDGSINLKIQPLKKIQNVKHGTLENEPTHIKSILDDLFKSI